MSSIEPDEGHLERIDAGQAGGLVQTVQCATASSSDIGRKVKAIDLPKLARSWCGSIQGGYQCGRQAIIPTCLPRSVFSKLPVLRMVQAGSGVQRSA